MVGVSPLPGVSPPPPVGVSPPTPVPVALPVPDVVGLVVPGDVVGVFVLGELGVVGDVVEEPPAVLLK